MMWRGEGGRWRGEKRAILSGKAQKGEETEGAKKKKEGERKEDV